MCGWLPERPSHIDDGALTRDGAVAARVADYVCYVRSKLCLISPLLPWRGAAAIPVPPTGKYFRCYLLFTRTSCNRPATDSGSSRERPRDVSPHPHSHVSRANGDAISRLVRSKGPQSSATGVEGHGALPLVVATCAMAAATSKMRAAPTAAAERARGDHCRAQRPLLGSVGAHTPPQHRPVPASEVVPPRTLCYARGNARTRSEVFIPCMCRRL